MPINNDFTSSLIRAFQTGRNIRMQQDEQTAAREKEAKDEEYRQKLFEENKKQFEREQNELAAERERTHKLNEAIFNITKSKAEQEFMQDARDRFEKLGILPPGYKEIEPGVFDDDDPNTSKFSALQPVEVSKKLVEANKPIQEAKTAEEEAIFKREQEAQAANRLAEHKLELEQLATEHQYRLKEIAAQVEAKKTTGVTEELSWQAKAVADNPSILADTTLMTPSQRGKVLGELKKMGIDIETPIQKSNYELVTKALEKVQALKNNKNFDSGFVAKKRAQLGDPKFVDFDNQITQIKNLLTVPEFKFMKGLGAMSDAEFNSLQGGATVLDLGGTKKINIDELSAIETILNKAKNATVEALRPKDGKVKIESDLREEDDKNTIYFDNEGRVVTPARPK